MIDTLWLIPLACSRNPYRHLVKHHKNGDLQSGHINDPELDAKLVQDVLHNQIDALAIIEHGSPETSLTYHLLTTSGSNGGGLEAVVSHIRGAGRPKAKEGQDAIRDLPRGAACCHQIDAVVGDAEKEGWPLAYALAWIPLLAETPSFRPRFDISSQRPVAWCGACGIPYRPQRSRL